MNYSKLFKCNLHGLIRINPWALKIIDTLEFQRLRNIKQLSVCSLVYPTATHTRFEHSLGVYYLTGKMLERIKKLYPEKEYLIPKYSSEKVKLNSKLIECIKIGALCHDIGHGPFSHTFDNIIKYLNPNSANIQHEVRSGLIVEILCKRELKDILSDTDISFIKSIILPDETDTGVLYQIVSNQMNDIDVDKFDYIARDSKNLGISTNFDSNQLLDQFIIDKNDNIAYPKHCSTDIYQMFHSRYLLHKKAYSHKTVILIECMMNDILTNLDQNMGISKSIDNMESFCKLTDQSIYQFINLNDFFKFESDSIQRATLIYQSIQCRILYKNIVHIIQDKILSDKLQEFVKQLPQTDKIKIIGREIGLVGKGKKDPFQSIFFYDKRESNNTFTLQKSHISGLMNDNLYEVHYHLICKDINMVKNITDQWNKYIS